MKAVESISTNMPASIKRGNAYTMLATYALLTMYGKITKRRGSVT